MESSKYREKLARYILIAIIICIAGYLCHLFSNAITYTLIAVVVSLLAKPIKKALSKIQIKKKSAPQWLLAGISISIVIFGVIFIFSMIIPIVLSIITDLSVANLNVSTQDIAEPLNNLNQWIINTFPNIDRDFRIEVSLFNELEKAFDFGIFSSAIGTAASVVSSFAVALFAIFFISFFFTKDNDLFSDIVASLTPDKHEKNAVAAIDDIEHLLTRYFGGVTIEVIGVGLVNFIGLYFIADLSMNVCIAIAFITGVLNIIPYVGPLIGGVIGTIIGVTFKFCSATPIGLDLGFIGFTLVLVAIFCFTQLIDNIVYQPLIYSSSIKAHPLEIFIVLLIAGGLFGPVAMVIAIPAYTVIRVIAFRFFGDVKFIKKLKKQS